MAIHRKDYGRLGILKDKFPDVPIIALTATARASVSEDVIKILHIPQCTRFSAGYDRHNLLFEVIEKESGNAPSKDQLIAYIRSHGLADKMGIVYCMTKADCEEIADHLRENGLIADFYHAGKLMPFPVILWEEKSIIF